MSAVQDEGMAPGHGEDDALLVALVLDPSTYSRNRFFDLHNSAVFRRVRRRASLVRSVVRHVCSMRREPPGDVRGAGGVPESLELSLSITPDDDGWSLVTYTVPRLGLRRLTRLEALEVSLLRFAVARARGGELPPDDVDRARVEDALRHLAEPRRLDRPLTPSAPPPETGLWDPP
ncbi:MAG: hypothetical protein WKG00_12170 [Polyangiaceae bacterium]